MHRQEVGQVHLTALAAGATGGFAPDFGGDSSGEPPFAIRWPTGRWVVKMTSSRRRRRAHAYRDGLLALALV